MIRASHTTGQPRPDLVSVDQPRIGTAKSGGVGCVTTHALIRKQVGRRSGQRGLSFIRPLIAIFSSSVRQSVHPRRVFGVVGAVGPGLYETAHMSMRLAFSASHAYVRHVCGMRHRLSVCSRNSLSNVVRQRHWFGVVRANAFSQHKAGDVWPRFSVTLCTQLLRMWTSRV